MITREQVKDLQPGDVVEMSWAAERGAQQSVKGPVVELSRGVLAVGGYWVREESGEPIQDAARRTLTVISRAPRPLYVNHDRTGPVPGDVVRDADSDDPMRVWLTSSNEDGDTWWIDYEAEWVDRSILPARLRLLVDGETGQVVP